MNAAMTMDWGHLLGAGLLWAATLVATSVIAWRIASAKLDERLRAIGEGIDGHAARLDGHGGEIQQLRDARAACQSEASRLYATQAAMGGEHAEMMDRTRELFGAIDKVQGRITGVATELAQIQGKLNGQGGVNVQT